MCTNGKKTRVQMHTGSKLFTFNSSHMTATSLSFSCHLELYLSSSDFGFFVFIEEMSLSGSTIGGCIEDFLQFGRDILFVTTHLSERYCGKVERPRLKTNLAGPASQISHRTYTEQSDREMDIWLNIQLLPENVRYKTLALHVTPVKLECSSEDALYLPCGGKDICVRRELRCDGMVNCPLAGGVWPGKKGV